MSRENRGGRTAHAVQKPRRVRYSVAMSLDGFIAGPNGQSDWIVVDPEIDFSAIYDKFDVTIMGRKTFEAMKESRGANSTPGMQVFVCSRTLRQEDNPGVTIVDDPRALLAELRSMPGKDLWLFGGGSLFRSFAELGLVDAVEVALIPVLLGEGVPLLPSPAMQLALKLTSHKLLAQTGTMLLEYSLQYGVEPKHR